MCSASVKRLEKGQITWRGYTNYTEFVKTVYGVGLFVPWLGEYLKDGCFIMQPGSWLQKVWGVLGKNYTGTS